MKSKVRPARRKECFVNKQGIINLKYMGVKGSTYGKCLIRP